MLQKNGVPARPSLTPALVKGLTLNKSEHHVPGNTWERRLRVLCPPAWCPNPSCCQSKCLHRRKKNKSKLKFQLHTKGPGIPYWSLQLKPWSMTWLQSRINIEPQLLWKQRFLPCHQTKNGREKIGKFLASQMFDSLTNTADHSEWCLLSKDLKGKSC